MARLLLPNFDVRVLAEYVTGTPPSEVLNGVQIERIPLVDSGMTRDLLMNAAKVVVRGMTGDRPDIVQRIQLEWVDDSRRSFRSPESRAVRRQGRRAREHHPATFLANGSFKAPVSHRLRGGGRCPFLGLANSIEKAGLGRLKSEGNTQRG